MNDEPDALQIAADGDPKRLALLRQRLADGEPLPYLLGHIDFRGRRFAMDRRAYITDPESSDLVDLVLEQGRILEGELGRTPHLLDFGVGAATMALSIKLEQPHWTLTGLDVDADALQLAQENASRHQADITLLQSNFLDSWPSGQPAPDLLFADPPWGSRSDLYEQQRDAHYYDQMPAASAYPAGGRTAIHDELNRRLVAAGWSTQLVLNYGVLPRALIERSAAPLAEWRLLHPKPGISVLLGRAITRQVTGPL